MKQRELTRLASSRQRFGVGAIGLLVTACSSASNDSPTRDVGQVDVGWDGPGDSDSRDISTAVYEPDVGNDVGDDGPAEPEPLWLPRSTVCGIAPEVLEYPGLDWEFAKPMREEVGGPFTVREFQHGIGTQRAMQVSPATHLTPPNTVGGALWLGKEEDVIIHLGVQSDPDEEAWRTGRIAVTPLINWQPVPGARYEVWKGDRSELKQQSSGTGAHIPMDSQTELIDLIIPGEAFEKMRASELAIAVRARSETRQSVNSLYIRFTVYAQGAHRPDHPCIPAANTRPIEEVFPFEEYNRYFLGRHFGLVKPRELDWGDLPGIHRAAPGSSITFDWFVYTHSPERTVALVPILNGKPVGPVEFTQVDNELTGEFRLAYDSSFTATMPEQSDGPIDVYVAEWFDPFYPIEDPYGRWVVFPEDDYHFHAGDRIVKAVSMGGTNALRYELEEPP